MTGGTSDKSLTSRPLYSHCELGGGAWTAPAVPTGAETPCVIENENLAEGCSERKSVGHIG